MIMMHRLFAIILMLCSACVFAQADSMQAHALVEEKINQLLRSIEQTKSQATFSDEQKIALVNEQLGDVVDFKRIARRVMAKYFRKASDAQKQQFLTVFKDSLLNTYAKGLWEFNDYKVNVLPLKNTKQTERNTQVIFEVVTSSGQIFPVTQSLFFNKKTNRWMVQNVIINGINMGLLFREQFARLVAQNNGDMDAAIAAWSSEVTQDDSSAASVADDADEVVEE